MRIGVPKEIKIKEYRVGLTPANARELISCGHEVWVEHNAGLAIGYDDKSYEAVGAKIAKTAKEVYEKGTLIIKVKEPQPAEYALIREDHILFTFLHLAPDPEQTEALVKSGCTAIAYETVTHPHGGLPLLLPMSEVAGRLSVQFGARYLEIQQGGSGVLLGGVPGALPAEVVVLGGGVAGTEAIRMAIGMGARVTVLDRSVARLKVLQDIFGLNLQTMFSTAQSVELTVRNADLVIGAVLIPGAAAPKIVTRSMISQMRPGSVLVDIAIDQGGCFETSRPTSFDEPVYTVDGVTHFCVTNMPGSVPRTSSAALNNATLHFALKLADRGLKALIKDSHFMNGLNIMQGHVTCEPVAKALGYPYKPAIELLEKL